VDEEDGIMVRRACRGEGTKDEEDCTEYEEEGTEDEEDGTEDEDENMEDDEDGIMVRRG